MQVHYGIVMKPIVVGVGRVIIAIVPIVFVEMVGCVVNALLMIYFPGMIFRFGMEVSL